MKIYDLTVFGVKNLKWISLGNSGYQQVWISSGNSRRESVSLAFAASRGSPLSLIWGPISGCSVVKNLPAMQEAWVWSLDQEDPLETGMANPRTEEPGRLQSMGSQRIRHNWATNTFTSWVLTGRGYKGTFSDYRSALYFESEVT